MATLNLEREWRDLEARAMDIMASSLQREECRRMFYAGAWSMFHGLMNILEPGTEPTDNDLKAIDAIKAQLDEWVAALKRRRA